MKPKIKSRDPDIRGSAPALRRAARTARKLAEQTNTPFHVWKNGKVAMLIVDAHLDLAYNALRGREVLRAASEQKADEDGIPSVGLPDLWRGKVGLICATIYSEPDEGKGKGYRTAEQAHAEAKRHVEWYQKQFAAGEMKLVRNAGELPTSPGRSISTIVLME